MKSKNLDLNVEKLTNFEKSEIRGGGHKKRVRTRTRTPHGTKYVTKKRIAGN